MPQQEREPTPEEIKPEAAKEEYEKARAEYVGAEIEKFVDEKIQLADAQAEQKEEGKLYKAWKRLGELNFEAADKKLIDKGIKNKWLKFGSRMPSIRTGISAALLGSE